MRLGVIGPGALGCLLAASFLEAGEDVILVDYRPERVKFLTRQGVLLKTLEGDEKVLKVPIALAPEAGPCHLAIMTVKSYQTAAAARSLPMVLAPGGLALTLQNGLGNLEEMARQVGWEPLLAGVALLGVTRRGEGEIVYAGRGAIFLGAPSGSRVAPPEIARVAEIFNGAGLECRPREDIEVVLWEKLLVNVGINPLTALLRVPNGALLQMPEAWDLAVAAASEAQAVARAGGIPVDADPESLLSRVCAATAANRSSMLQDVLAGRPTEIEALNAQVVARGQALGVPTPVNNLLTQILRALSRAAPHPPI